MPAKKIFVDYIDWTNTEDTLEEGEVGPSHTVLAERLGTSYNSIKELSKDMNHRFGIPTVEESEDGWYVFEDQDGTGRIDVQFMVNEDNVAPLPSEMLEWRRGERRLWAAYVVIGVKLGSIYIPRAKELAKFTGLSTQ
jgi:hypothetical protein